MAPVGRGAGGAALCVAGAVAGEGAFVFLPPRHDVAALDFDVLVGAGDDPDVRAGLPVVASGRAHVHRLAVDALVDVQRVARSKLADGGGDIVLSGLSAVPGFLSSAAGFFCATWYSLAGQTAAAITSAKSAKMVRMLYSSIRLTTIFFARREDFRCTAFVICRWALVIFLFASPTTFTASMCRLR